MPFHVEEYARSELKESMRVAFYITKPFQHQTVKNNEKEKFPIYTHIYIKEKEEVFKSSVP